MENVFQLEAGSVLVERYQIVRRLGGGGMGSVYLARDKRLADSYRAVKEMIGTYSDEAQRKKVVEDFERESQLLASLDHPAIPTIYDYFITEGCYYLVMKYISGGDLSERQKKAAGGIVDERVVTEWGMQIADVLSYLHQQSPPIIYRDMKPANVMLDERDRIVLVDFGIARFVASTQKNVTAIGTMGYAPPELFAGKVEPRSDIYSLGATMFHLLTGRDPQDNPLLMFDFNRNQRPKQINPKLSDEMDAILARAVEHKPANRFSSAAELKTVLEDHLRRLNGGVSVPVSQPVQAAAPATAPAEASFCGQCGQKLIPDNLFCPYCGAPLKPGQAAATPATASLVFIAPNNQTLSFIISKETNLVGRLDTNRGIFPDIDLTPYDKDGKVSRRHATIIRKNDLVSIEDLNSTNGTFINSERLLPKQPYPLSSGDELRLGETTLKFFVGAIPASIASTPPRDAVSGGSSAGVVTYKSGSANKQTVIGAPQPAPPPPPGFQPKLPGVRASGSSPVLPASQSSASSAVQTSNPAPSSSPVAGSSSLAAPDAKPAANQNGESKKVEFLTNVDFTGKVKLNKTVPLQVGLLSMKDSSSAGRAVQKLHEHDSQVSIVYGKSEVASKDVQVDIYIAAPGFEIEPDIFARISAPIYGNVPPKIFQLKAVQAGSTTITVDFYQDADYLSSVTIDTVVVE